MKLYTNKGEFNNTLSVVRWVNMISSGIQSLGREPSPGYQLEGWMKEAGFVNVKSQLLAIPVGPWPRDKNLVSQVSGIRARLTLRFRKRSDPTIY